ncbi:MAG: tripartite tricarboxylate transporter substrate binding protein, partial [Burkholderiales bacterium]
MFFRRFSGQLVGAMMSAGALIGATNAVGQGTAWPTRPMKIVVPLTPGGSNDVLGRLLAERLQTGLGQPVVVENRPGAGGNLGTEYVAKQPPDGHTLLISSNTHVINTNFFAKLPYHPFDDFETISIIATIPFVMSVNAASPAKSVNDFIDLARAKPGTLTYATAGIGTPHHLSAELLKSMAGIDMVHVPYKGAAGLVPALVANEVSMTIGAINSLLPHFRAGRLRPLAVVGAQRTPLLPDVPPMAEAANLPGYALDIWIGVLAPAKTPRAIVERLNTEINKVMRDPQLIK